MLALLLACVYTRTAYPTFTFSPDILALRSSPATSPFSTVKCSLYIARRLPMLCFSGLLLSLPCGRPHPPFRRSLPDLSICPLYRSNIEMSNVFKFQPTVPLVFRPASSLHSSVRARSSRLFALCFLVSFCPRRRILLSTVVPSHPLPQRPFVRTATASSSPSSRSTRRIRTVQVAHRSPFPLVPSALYNTAIVCHFPPRLSSAAACSRPSTSTICPPTLISSTIYASSSLKPNFDMQGTVMTCGRVPQVGGDGRCLDGVAVSRDDRRVRKKNLADDGDERRLLTLVGIAVSGPWTTLWDSASSQSLSSARVYVWMAVATVCVRAHSKVRCGAVCR